MAPAVPPWDLPRMTTCESDSLSQFYPIADQRFYLTEEPEGWLLEERHRHETGVWGQCQTIHCERMTVAEVLDVIDAIASSRHRLELP